MKKFLLLTAIASVASVAAVAPAMAQSVTSSFTVGAGAPKSCTTPSALNVGLGNYDGTAAVTQNNTITFKCTNTTPATVTLLSTNAPSNTGGNLKNGANTIAYTMTGNGSTATGSGITAGAAAISVLSAVTVAAGQNPVPGAYSDTVSITVTY
jgi:spore coat protein U-like protein